MCFPTCFPTVPGRISRRISRPFPSHRGIMISRSHPATFPPSRPVPIPRYTNCPSRGPKTNSACGGLKRYRTERSPLQLTTSTAEGRWEGKCCVLAFLPLCDNILAILTDFEGLLVLICSRVMRALHLFASEIVGL